MCSTLATTTTTPTTTNPSNNNNNNSEEISSTSTMADASTTCTKRRISGSDQHDCFPKNDIENPHPPLLLDDDHNPDADETVDLLLEIALDDDDDSNDTTIQKQQQPNSCWTRICAWAEPIMQRGPAVLLTHFMMSNFAKVVFTTISWYFYCLHTGKSPLFPDQTQPFLAIFGTFLAFDMFWNPIRLAVAMTKAPKMDRLLQCLQPRLCYDSIALAAFVVWVGIIVLNLLLVALGITISSFLAGVPIWEP